MSEPLNIRGAVDLSALAPAKEQERMKAQTTNENGEQVIPGPFVRDVTMESVQSFLELSLHVPLVVVFTSPRSEGSLALAKTLESQILSRGGAIGLGLVEADSSPEIAQAFQVQAVPTTLAVLGGNPVPLFQGTMDDADVAKALDSVLQAAEQLSVHGRLDGDEDGSLPEPELPPHVKEANEALSAGDFDKAHAAYTKALKENPGDEVAKVELARVELLQRVQGYDVQSIMSTAKDADLTDVDLHLQASDIEVAASRPESAFGRLLAVIRATSGDDREKARERIVALFNIVGIHDPLVTEVRKQLASALM
ncbi:tetratricopeptide repeat protein [Flaviflexus ciconiae]|uniref:Tetratricopeptide repeat protein n=1 Tax=Flaviflexus ciconiae TaxID=2496867 RepID=A0A3S9PXQ7_9ACTO|nr:tetratricopeptide repeat protein [Flaviflexus ciconiae]AZQ77095.1 tetratricopeptide repeat protein [Flaviflexus ciconiae]